MQPTDAQNEEPFGTGQANQRNDRTPPSSQSQSVSQELPFINSPDDYVLAQLQHIHRGRAMPLQSQTQDVGRQSWIESSRAWAVPTDVGMFGGAGRGGTSRSPLVNILRGRAMPLQPQAQAVGSSRRNPAVLNSISSESPPPPIIGPSTQAAGSLPDGSSTPADGPPTPFPADGSLPDGSSFRWVNSTHSLNRRVDPPQSFHTQALDRLYHLVVRAGATPEPVYIHCPVCLDGFHRIKSSGRNLMSTVCGHMFCSSCLPVCVRSNGRCPTCRKPLGSTDTHPIFL